MSIETANEGSLNVSVHFVARECSACYSGNCPVGTLSGPCHRSDRMMSATTIRRPAAISLGSSLSWRYVISFIRQPLYSQPAKCQKCFSRLGLERLPGPGEFCWQSLAKRAATAHPSAIRWWNTVSDSVKAIASFRHRHNTSGIRLIKTGAARETWRRLAAALPNYYRLQCDTVRWRWEVTNGLLSNAGQ